MNELELLRRTLKMRTCLLWVSILLLSFVYLRERSFILAGIFFIEAALYFYAWYKENYAGT